MARLTTGAVYPDLAEQGYDPETARIAEQMITAERELLAARKDALEAATAARACFPIRPPLRRPAVAECCLQPASSPVPPHDTHQSSSSGSGEASTGCGRAEGPGGSDQGARRQYGHRWRLRTRYRSQTPRSARGFRLPRRSAHGRSVPSTKASGRSRRRVCISSVTTAAFRPSIRLSTCCSCMAWRSVLKNSASPISSVSRAMTRTCFIECSGNGLRA